MTIPTVEGLAVILIGLAVGGALLWLVVDANTQFRLGRDRDHDR